MLKLEEIEKQYPVNLRAYKRNILREYLQYKILEIIFNSRFADKLSFLGGTALRIVHNNTRFSEDLDFDNFSLTKDEFGLIAQEVKREMSKIGFAVEIRNVFKGAFHCYIKLPRVLFNNNLSAMPEEKILIQFDTVSHNFKYVPDKVILNKFDVFTQIFSTPLDVLLSQKIYAIFNRKRAKGRDYYDTVFLIGLTKPNYEYLKMKIGIDNSNDLKKELLIKADNQDLFKLAKDVREFLFKPSDAKRVEMFKEYIKGVNF